MSLCNYCTLRYLQRKHPDKIVEARASEELPGWIAIVIDGEETVWLLELTDHCVC